MASAQATEAQASTFAGARPGGLKEWFWRGHALQSAKAAPKPSVLRRERLRRARLAAELADRTIDPAEPLRDGSALPLAITLFREAAYWVLLAHSEAGGAGQPTPTMRELLDARNYAQPTLAEADLAIVHSVLADKTFVETAEQRSDELCREADLCQAFVHGLIHSELEAEDKVTSVLVQRWVRVGVLAIIVAVALFVLYGSITRALQGPDLAAGKPWRASSKAFECHPKEMECGGARSAIFFHTTEEEKPWVEIDLGSPQTFSRLEVVNREDCCYERASPLVAEVSSDRAQWSEVGRRTDQFRDWSATFKPTTARYVRVRADRRTTLHLVRVSVRPN
jgi:hypothetical protein